MLVADIPLIKVDTPPRWTQLGAVAELPGLLARLMNAAKAQISQNNISGATQNPNPA